jgi:hypothetical protein
MVSSEHNWARSLVRRGLVAVIMVLALATYGLVTSGTQSLAFKPTAASASTTAGRAVSMALSPSNGSVNVAAQGPNHTLYFYWQISGTWYGPLGLGAAGSAWSAPTIIAETGPNAGNFDIAVQGPNNTLDFYWDISGTWYGPFQVGGAGTTFSTPALVQDKANNLQIAAEGAANSLNVFWNVNAQFYGPLGIAGPNTTFAGPALERHPNFSNATVFAYTQGPNHVVDQYTRSSNVWSGAVSVGSDNSIYSAIAPFSTTFRVTFQGPNNSLWDAVGNGDPSDPKLDQIRGGGTTYSMPAVVGVGGQQSSGGPGARYIAAEGPSNTLFFYFPNANSSDVSGPLQIGAPGTAFSAPSLIIDANSNQDIVVQGPSHTLWAYFDIAGVIHGPLQIGAADSTFSSDN